MKSSTVSPILEEHDESDGEGDTDEKLTLLLSSKKNRDDATSKKNATVSRRVAKLQRTARIVLRIRRALLQMPQVSWDDIRNALAEVAALGLPRKEFVSDIAFPELDLSSDVLEDHDLVTQLRTALETAPSPQDMPSSSSPMKVLQETIKKGKCVRRQSVQMQFLMKSAEAVLTLQTGMNSNGQQSEQDVEKALEGMDMDALREAIRVTSMHKIDNGSGGGSGSMHALGGGAGKHSGDFSATSMSPTVTRLLTSAQLVHRLHSTRSMRNWEEMDAVVRDADAARSSGALTDKAALLADMARSEIRHRNVRLELVSALNRGGVSGTIDAVITDSIEHGDLDRAIKACNILLWKKSSGGSVSALGGNTTTTTSSPSSASPQLCRLIKIANITRELRLGFALQDWSAIRKATEDFNALRDTHMLDAAEIHRRKNTAKGTVDSKGSKLGAAVTAASLHRKSTFGNFTTTVFAPAQGRDSASSNAEQVDDHLLLFPRRWLEHSVGECAREFEFATLASHHHEIMHKLTKSLKEGPSERHRGFHRYIDSTHAFS